VPGALGIVIKISDGDLAPRDLQRGYSAIVQEGGGRARSTTAVETLRQLAALDEAQLRDLADYLPRPQRNWRGIPVGEIRPCFDLHLG